MTKPTPTTAEERTAWNRVGQCSWREQRLIEQVDALEGERDEERRIRLLADEAIRKIDKHRATLRNERDALQERLGYAGKILEAVVKEVDEGHGLCKTCPVADEARAFLERGETT